jgi:hypothetical protein
MDAMNKKDIIAAARQRMDEASASDIDNRDRAAALAWLQSPAAAQLMDREERARLLRIYHLEASR